MSSFWTSQLAVNALVAGLGGLQYGYHLAELNAPEAALSCRAPPLNTSNPSWFENHGLKQCIPLDTGGIGLVTSQYPIGGLVGSGVAGIISEKFGRKNASIIISLLFAVGSFIETFADTKAHLATGRFISGLGAGSTLVNSPLILNEIAFDEVKGFLGTLNQIFGNFGILLTQALGIWWANGHQWRYILFTGFTIALLNLLVSFGASETPKWLVKSNQTELARQHLTGLRHSDAFSEHQINDEIDRWVEEIGSTNSDGGNRNESASENSGLLSNSSNNKENSPITLWEYITSKEYRNSRLVATIVMLAQQLSGIPAIMFYGVTVISALLPQYSVIINCGISLLNLLFTSVSGALIDRVGRKALLLFSNTTMCICTFLMAIGIINDIAMLTVIAVFAFVSAFAIGMGPIPFLMISEVTQLNATTVAQSYGTAMNWIITVLIGYVFPSLNDAIGGYVFMIFTGFCGTTAVLVWRFFPETKGKKSYNEVWGIEDN